MRPTKRTSALVATVCVCALGISTLASVAERASVNAAPVTIAYRGGSQALKNTKQLWVKVPAAAQPGDLLVLIASANRTDVPVTAPAGWNRLDRVVDGTLQSLVWWRKAVAGDAGVGQPVSATATTKLMAHMLAYSGTAATPILAYAKGAEPGTTASHTTPTVNVATAGSRLLSYWSDKTNTATGWTSPSDVVRRLQSVGSGSSRLTALSGDGGGAAAVGSAGGITARSSVSSAM